MTSEPCESGAEAIAVCPHCGAAIPARCLFVERPQSPDSSPDAADSVANWHRSPPDYPPPTGCRRIWVPLRGYFDVNDDHRHRVDRFFAAPMLVLALLVLPVLVVDYYLSFEHGLLTWGVLICHTTISAAFLAEFVVKVSIAQSRFEYVLRNWLDLIIILLPFLRPFRALRAARLLEFSRVYAVRGVGFKAVRTAVPVVLGLRFVQRFRRHEDDSSSRRPLDYARWPRAALIAEIKRLTDRLDELEHSAGCGDDGAALNGSHGADV